MMNMKRHFSRTLYLLLVLSLGMSLVSPASVAAQPAPVADRELGTELPSQSATLTAGDFTSAEAPLAAENEPLTASDFPMGGPPANQADLAGQSGDGTDGPLAPVSQAACARTITADIVALDQPFYYNRLGAINANGMMYALARDVVTTAAVGTTPAGTVVAGVQNRAGLAGQVSLRADKRPRPIVLRMNEGDCLDINFTNLLDPEMFIFNLNPDAADLTGGTFTFPIDPALNEVDNQPLTREASIHIDGLHLVGDIGSDGSKVGRNAANGGDGLVLPGESTTYTYYAAHEATHLLYSMGSTIGAEGGGGTRTYGLFGAVNVQKAGAEWYRSQLTRQEMDWAASAWELDLNGNPTEDPGNNNPSFDANGDPVVRTTLGGQPILNYNAVYPEDAGPAKVGLPIINMLNGNELVHTDINAIITGPGRGRFPAGTYQDNLAAGDRNAPYREFTVIFHDEAFGVQAFPAFYADPVLKHTLHGVRDSFPINYGSGGIGSEIIANRLGVGPMWDCTECKYEEFFLTSFTVGDPAMIVDIPANATDEFGNIIPGAKATMALYPDDPSNVHHAYLNDRVKFRNLHAGPKEHHIFHLHAHQWLFNPDDPQSNYLDGQAVGPGAGYTYEIAYGGSGNRNKTPGDSIFHCHFYPHFAQGMWEMWRVHDVFEQGTLLDATALTLNPAAGQPAAGSRALPDGEIAAGTPIPGVVPIPTNAMAPMPDAAATIVASDLNGDDITDSSQFDANGDGTADIDQVADPAAGLVDADGPNVRELTNPGYPWFTPGLMGHRPATPALDILDDGGLPRHVVISGPDEDFAHPGAPVEQYQTRLDFNKILHEAEAIQIPEAGTPAEQVAMAFHAQQWWPSYKPDGSPANFETNGLPPAPGAPFADPCRADGGGPIPGLALNASGSPIPNRTIKGANIEMPITLNRVGWHFQQQRFEALWEDVVPMLTHQQAPQPMVMRLNSTDCAEFWHTNLVPNVYQLDDYQVRTPTDIIGQHIHLVKFDVMSADGSANGWNYEDGTLSPDEVRERIGAFNHGGGFWEVGATAPITNLLAAAHPFFGDTGPAPANQNWLGARTTIQRWYADPLLERSWDGGVGTVFTHDHYGPSTHQQVGLYSTLLVEPEGSVWKHNETGELLATRHDGGPTTWQAIIETTDPSKSHREFYFEFADFQHAYEAGGGDWDPNFTDPDPDGSPDPIGSYADFPNAINPSVRVPAPNLADIYLHPVACPGLPGQEPTRPCPEAISADDPGTYALNFRNEPIALRVFDPDGTLDSPGINAGQAAGDAGDLAFAFRSDINRAIPELNVQPESNGISPYPPLTADLQPGDPWTPMMRAYMGDKVRIRVQVGAHEEEHNFTLHGLKWRKEGNSPNSGWRNAEFFGIDEYFNVDVPIVPDVNGGGAGSVDYMYNVGSEVEGTWNGVWGILRTYAKARNDLAMVSNNQVGKQASQISNAAEFDGICPVSAPLRTFNVTAVRADQILGPQGLVYNSRDTQVNLVTALDADGNPTQVLQGQGPLIDPTALMYVLDEDLTFDPVTGQPNGLQAGLQPEPLILRANAGDCIQVSLTNALTATQVFDADGITPIGWAGQEDMDGFSALPPIVHKDENADLAGGITTFNMNDMDTSSYVGLHAQLLAFDVRLDDGFAAAGNSLNKLVPPGGNAKYKWYAGDVTATYQGIQRNRAQYRLSASPVEFGAVNLMPADRVKGTTKGLIGGMVIEPQGATWQEDPGTRAQATVTKPDGSQFRDFVTIMQNDISLRYGGGACEADPSPITCAVPNIAAEGPLGPPEDPQDSGQKAINYGADPLWFRLGIAPNTPFGFIHRNAALEGPIRDVFSNDLAGVDGDPQTEVYVASPNGPAYGRLRVMMPSGHARGVNYTLHGHEWQSQPYTDGSSKIGHNPISQYYGTQEGINPAGHYDFVVNLGGYFDVVGDYLWRDQASIGSYQGLWGILRFDGSAPVAVDDSASTQVGTPVIIDVLANDLILDGLGSIMITTQPLSGTAVLNPDNTVTYTPDAGFKGTDSFGYQITDQAAGTEDSSLFDTATVTVNVLGQGVNIPPVAQNVITTTQEDIAIAITLTATDPEGCELTFTALNPANGSLSPITDQACQTGSGIFTDTAVITFTPQADFNGTAFFTYIANDGKADSGQATVTIEVTPVNDAPVAAIDAYTVGVDTVLNIAAPGVLDNDTDIDGDVLTTTLETGPDSGDLILNLDGSFTYSPTVTGTLSFSYVASDGVLTDTASVTLTVTQGNQPPVAVDDGTSDEPVATTSPGQTVTVNVVQNDDDPDGTIDVTSVVTTTNPSSGTVVINANGTLDYTPDVGFTSGTDSFGYTVKDNQGATSNEATVFIAVQEPTPELHIGDLDAIAIDNGKTWAAVVTITVHVANENPVAGATVSGLWTTDAPGPVFGECQSDVSGQCTLTLTGTTKKVKNVTFTVTGVVKESYAYNSAANHDPDVEDSDGTVIVVSKP